MDDLLDDFIARANQRLASDKSRSWDLLPVRLESSIEEVDSTLLIAEHFEGPEGNTQAQLPSVAEHAEPVATLAPSHSVLMPAAPRSESTEAQPQGAPKPSAATVAPHSAAPAVRPVAEVEPNPPSAANGTDSPVIDPQVVPLAPLKPVAETAERAPLETAKSAPPDADALSPAESKRDLAEPRPPAADIQLSSELGRNRRRKDRNRDARLQPVTTQTEAEQPLIEPKPALLAQEPPAGVAPKGRETESSLPSDAEEVASRKATPPRKEAAVEPGRKCVPAAAAKPAAIEMPPLREAPSPGNFKTKLIGGIAISAALAFAAVKYLPSGTSTDSSQSAPAHEPAATQPARMPSAPQDTPKPADPPVQPAVAPSTTTVPAAAATAAQPASAATPAPAAVTPPPAAVAPPAAAAPPPAADPPPAPKVAPPPVAATPPPVTAAPQPAAILPPAATENSQATPPAAAPAVAMDPPATASKPVEKQPTPEEKAERHKPTKKADKPAAATRSPEKSKDQPEESHDQPEKPSDKPAKAVDKPAKAVDKPAKPVDKPAKPAKPEKESKKKEEGWIDPFAQ